MIEFSFAIPNSFGSIRVAEMAELPDKTELPDDSDPSASQAPVRQNPKWVVDQAYLSRLRELELELDKTRSEAHAARLDARAAELKLRIQKLGGHVRRQDQVAPQDQNEHGETLKRPAGQSRSDPGSIPTPLQRRTGLRPGGAAVG